MAYLLNNTDLSTFGITISKLTGFENLPKRKGKTEYSYPNLNGVDAFTDSTDIIFEARDLEIKGNLVADSIESAQTQFLAFQDWVYQSGDLNFWVSYLERVFIVYVKDAPKGNRINDIGGKVYYDLVFKLREIDPTNELLTNTIVDFDTTEFGDFDNEIFYVII